MNNRNSKKRKQHDRPGRPKKVSKISINSGRKRIAVKDCARRTLYKRANEILEEVENDTKVLEVALSIGKKRTVEANNSTDSDNEILSDELKQTRHSKDSALAFYLEYNFSKATYEAVAKDSRSRNCSIYPSYRSVTDAMNECKLPNCNISEVEVVVPLSDVLKKTGERLCEAVALHWEVDHLRNLELIVTLGFDSSSGHLNPHQQYGNEENENLNPEQCLFVSSMSVIKLKNCTSDKHSWVNPTPQSTRFCRPLRIAFEKEDVEATLREYRRLTNEIEQLTFYRFNMSNGKSVTIKFVVFQTLFDGKCINTITGNKATSKCPMCLRSTHQFSNLEDEFVPQEASLKLGLGLLHAEIKAMEHLLHVSYRSTIKTWDVRENLKEQYKARKNAVQKKLYDTLKVRVDQVLQGHGTTNTGNLARRCFKQPRLFAEALDIDATLVCNIATVIEVFKCRMNIKIPEFENFCLNTYRLHYKLFSWARMNPSLHKLLIHGCDIAKRFPLPIAYFSEDCSEAWHKLYRKNMIMHSRQTSRIDRITDVFNRAVYETDPKISLIFIANRLKMQKKMKMTPNARHFIAHGECFEEENSEDTDSTTSFNSNMSE